MEHVTACYWQKETPAELFLSLQQRKYRRLGISVVCACISDNGELVRSLQNKMEEELEEENVWRPESYAWGAEYCFSVTGECGSVDVFRDSAGHNGGRCRNPAWREKWNRGRPC